MRQIIEELASAARGLGRSRAAMGKAIVVLALGTGSAVAAFSVVDAVLLRPFPFRDQDRLVVIWQRSPQLPFVEVSYPAFVDWGRQSGSFTDLALLASVDQPFLWKRGGTTVQVTGRLVSWSFFDVLGARPRLGRGFRAEDDRQGAARVVVLSHALWEGSFGGDPGVVGRAIDLDGTAFTVIGVMDHDFRYPPRAQLWTTVVPASPEAVADPSVWWALVIGRLRDGATLAQARAEMDTLVDRAHRERGDAGYRAVLTPLVDDLLGDTKAKLRLLSVAVGLAMLAACGSAAGLVLIRTTQRQREISIRMALGASRSRIVMLLCGEAVLLALVAGACAIPLTYAGVRVLAAAAPRGLLRLGEVSLDGRALAFAIGVSVLGGMLVSVAPAWQGARQEVAGVLKASAPTLAHRNRAGALLVAGEVAFAVALLAPAGLIGRTHSNLRGAELGFEARNLLTMEIVAPGWKYPDPEKRRALWTAVQARVAALPGVLSSGGVLLRPLWGTAGLDWWFALEGQSEDDVARNPRVVLEVVTPDYFRTMRIPISRGRVFDERDVDGSPGVVVVSQSMADRVWPGRDPVGQQLRIPVPGTRYHFAPLAVVGVVGDVRYRELQATRPSLYLTFQQSPESLRHLVLRTDREPRALSPAVRREIRALDADVAVEDVITMEDVVTTTLAGLRFTSAVLLVLASFAALTAALAVYAAMSDSVARRTREIGLRMALGATRGQLLSLVMREAMAAPLAGLLVGIGGALAVARVFDHVLFGVAPGDPATLATVSAAIVGACMLAAYLPARQAMRIDPVRALRRD